MVLCPLEGDLFPATDHYSYILYDARHEMTQKTDIKWKLSMQIIRMQIFVRNIDNLQAFS